MGIKKEEYFYPTLVEFKKSSNIIEVKITIETCWLDLVRPVPDKVHGIPQGRPLGSFLLRRRRWRVVNISDTAGLSSSDKTQ